MRKAYTFLKQLDNSAASYTPNPTASCTGTSRFLSTSSRNFVKGRWYWRGKGYPSADINLRNISPDIYTIVNEKEGNRVIGTIDEASAYQQVHSQAIYLHEAETYFVRDLDTEKKIAFVEKTNVDYYTQSITEVQVKVDREEKRKDWRVSAVSFGDVSVTSLTFMFRKIKFGSRDSIGYGRCELPLQIPWTGTLPIPNILNIPVWVLEIRWKSQRLNATSRWRK